MQLPRQQKWLLPLMIISWVAIAYCYHLMRPSYDITKYANRIQGYFSELEADLEKNVNNKKFLQNCVAPDSLGKTSPSFEKQLTELRSKPYAIYIYNDKGESIFWSNHYIPVPKDPCKVCKRADEGRITLINLGRSTSTFGILKDSVVVNGERYDVYGFIPIKYNYMRETDYLVEEYAVEQRDGDTNKNYWKTPISDFQSLRYNIHRDVQITQEVTDFPVKDLGNNTVFYLKASRPLVYKLKMYWMFFALIFGFIVNTAFAWQISREVGERRGFFYGLLLFVGCLAAIRTGLYLLDINALLWKIPIFDPAFSDSLLGNSLAEFILNITIICISALFVQSNLKARHLSHYTAKRQTQMVALGYAAIILGVFAIMQGIRHLVLHTNVLFDFENIVSLDYNGIVDIVGIMLLLVALFLVTHRISVLISQTSLTLNKRLMLLACLALGISLAIFLTGIFNGSEVGQLALFSVIYIVSFDIFVESEETNFTWLALWLFIFSFFSSYLLYRYSSEKERIVRLDFAKEMLQTRNSTTEESLDELAKEILLEGTLSDAGDMEEVEELLESRHALDLNFSDSEISFYKMAIDTLEDSPYLQFMEESAPTESAYVRYWRPKNSVGGYVVVLDVQPSKNNKLLLHFVQKELGEAKKVYGEVFVSNKQEEMLEIYANYNYAIYINGKIERSELSDERFSFGEQLKPGLVPPKGEYRFVENAASHSELIYTSPEGLTIIVAQKIGSRLLKWGAFFAYLFAVLVVVLFVMLFIGFLVRRLSKRRNPSLRFSLSLRNRIQFSIIIVIIFNFIVVTFFTIRHLNEKNTEYHTKRANRKSYNVLKDAEQDIKDRHITADSMAAIKNLAKELSYVHSLDINIYDKKGVIVSSSEKEIFEMGVLSPRMNSDAFYKLSRLKQDHTQENEKVGHLHYSTTYLTLNSNNKLMGYLALPYYAERSNLLKDNSEYIKSLLNLYVLLLIVAGVVSIIVANSITKPIAVIGEKLREVKLGKKSEKLEWKGEDELGVLVDEYNNMVAKLEGSAKMLAQTEREGAWREMAKQVAHEIKNPLTPMKLSIQYLQHAYKARPDDLDALFERVAQTLVEQIDNLARIATEFSNFAKMPKGENIVFELNGLVQSVFELFSETGGRVNVELHMAEAPLYIFADKDQIMRVLNNVIKNAIQAIPDGRKGLVLVSLYKESNLAVVRVDDNGAGIPDSVSEFIFVPNFTTKSTGSGLGLAICKNIVEAVNGSIYFRTKENEGTSFYVEFPLEEEAAQ
jgi:two-component system nitrogen regulation sensor histidine kinase NtrY